MRTYNLPPIDQRGLLATLMDAFPAHKQAECRTLLHDLVHAYAIWWVLMATFESRRIVGTAPLWVVREAHAQERERFFSDCFEYLGKIPGKETIWNGPHDIRGALDTARSLNELLDQPALVWRPIMQTASEIKDNKIISLV